MNIRITHLLAMTDEQRRQLEEANRRANEQSQRDAAAKRS